MEDRLETLLPLMVTLTVQVTPLTNTITNPFFDKNRNYQTHFEFQEETNYFVANLKVASQVIQRLYYRF